MKSAKVRRQKSKSHLRLLTRDEYQNTVADILGVTTDIRSSLPSELVIFGFDNNADSAMISDAHATAYLDVAETIAGQTKARLKSLAGCEETEGASCATKFIDKVVPLLWRRPPLNQSNSRY